MWQQIIQQINDEVEQPFIFVDKQQLAGSELNRIYKLQGETKHYFAKINQRPYFKHFKEEALSLKTLRQHKALSVPNVICYGQTLDNAFLILDYLKLTEPTDSHWQQLATQIAHMHQQLDQAMFGFDWDNYIGHTLQPNKWQNNWSSFFSEQRIGWQLQLLVEQGFGFGNVDAIVEKTRQRLQGYQPAPSLLHGDLWRGNVGFSADEAWLFDPACYYGDRETDIAYSQLFGRFPDAFYNHYHALLPLDPNFEQRKELYNLYHILNHANLFRGAYLVQAQQVIKQLFF
ncbi:fructosamine kinase family protein [Rheinheimera salexigens]|uniref:Fructosamine kinase n=1 Tax=Rheinheimera salexigens TaxID=1628148 RepID=A0A1E7Q7A5_9GAMM|nr:fructosamine kinase family protein [Rheinheimera salexigens]OEY70007.1 fructosamine kinase [Rheinheimera salexigens]